MKEKINKYIDDINNIVISNIEDAENFQQKYLSKKGVLNQLFIEFKGLPTSKKKQVGKLLNQLKQIATSKAKSITIPKQKSKKNSLLQSLLWEDTFQDLKYL